MNLSNLIYNHYTNQLGVFVYETNLGFKVLNSGMWPEEHITRISIEVARELIREDISFRDPDKKLLKQHKIIT